VPVVKRGMPLLPSQILLHIHLKMGRLEASKPYVCQIMIILSLNIRGIGGPLKTSAFRRLLLRLSPNIILLQETLTDGQKARFSSINSACIGSLVLLTHWVILEDSQLRGTLQNLHLLHIFAVVEYSSPTPAPGIISVKSSQHLRTLSTKEDLLEQSRTLWTPRPPESNHCRRFKLYHKLG
jgi:hypothetical protein